MPTSLPQPSPAARVHSDQLREFIRRDIALHGGWIPFSRFMELALYAPGLGYYTAGARKLGAAGDFVTAPEISPLFGRTLARQVADIMAQSVPQVMELGAGSGKLAADILGELERLGCLPERYDILEVSADLRARQQALLREHLPHLFNRVHWLDALPENISGVVIANEVLDALPVHLVHWRAAGTHGEDAFFKERPPTLTLMEPLATRLSPQAGKSPVIPRREREQVLFERGVASERENFIWQERLPENPGLLQIAQQIRPEPFDYAQDRLAEAASLPDDYLSEISLAVRGLVGSLCERLQQGVLLFIDYGFGAGEYYHPQRSSGTLMCHYRHHAHTDPFFLIGLQDITAHVDFTAVAESAIASKAHLLGYTSQAHFLINCGITDLLAESNPENLRDYLPQSSQLQKLTSPAEMGELFKVIALGKGFGAPLRGFASGDKSRFL
ncbi:MAG: SAM-dependent methyltransferase [Gallionellaceae bacterium]|nr:SAM-dependent methyltransferase [Gallionellaceae bacterium]